ncbi:MAG: M48 family metallopeptidase [Candidatus Paceibacterota bacterium]
MTKSKTNTNGALTKESFKAEVEQWGEEIGVEISEVHVRQMKRKWGSCSTSGRLTFDTELLEKPDDFRKEVIVHEVLHLKVPNHGKVFRALLKAYLGKTTIATRRVTN